MTAALHLVPDPDDETPPPDTAGEQHPNEAAPAADVEPGQEDAPEEDTELGDDKEEPVRVRALAMPDLRPYASLAWIPAVINAGLEGARRWRQRAPERKAARRAAKAQAAGEPVGRACLVAMAADYLAGTRLLVGYLVAWLSGEYGPKDMKVPARLAVVGLAGYCGYRTVTSWPVWGPVSLAVVYCAAALGALHRQRAEQGNKRPAPAAAKGVAKVPGPPPAEGPVEDAEEAPAEPSPTPSREVISGALHGLVGEGRGVLLTTLCQHLSLPHTRAVREALDGAGIRVRPGVRTVAGNGPGIHVDDFPPLPSPQEGASDLRCWPTANANNAANASQKGLSVEGNDPDGGRPYRIEQAPERGPNAWRVVPRGDNGS